MDEEAGQEIKCIKKSMDQKFSRYYIHFMFCWIQVMNE